MTQNHCNNVFQDSSTTRLFTASLVMPAKEKVNKASERVGVPGFVSEASKKNREAVDIFGKKWTY